jgi:hypothetical protein
MSPLQRQGPLFPPSVLFSYNGICPRRSDSTAMPASDMWWGKHKSLLTSGTPRLRLQLSTYVPRFVNVSIKWISVFKYIHEKTLSREEKRNKVSLIVGEKIALYLIACSCQYYVKVSINHIIQSKTRLISHSYAWQYILLCNYGIYLSLPFQSLTQQVNAQISQPYGALMKFSYSVWTHETTREPVDRF